MDGRRRALVAGSMLVLGGLVGCSSGGVPAGGGTPAGSTAHEATPTTGPTAQPTAPLETAAPPSPGVASLPAGAPSSTAPGQLALAGRTVALDAGHNGGTSAQPARAAALVEAGGFRKACNTSGASTDAGYPEHAFTYDVVQRAAALLRARGARVVLTRDDDTGFGPCVDARAAIANAAHADAAVSVHADGGPASGRGFHVIAPAPAPDRGNAAVLDEGYRLALALRTSFAAATGEAPADYIARDGLVRRSDLAGLDLARVPAAFLECANMRNAQDAVNLTSPAWRQRAAQGVADAVGRYLTAAR